MKGTKMEKTVINIERAVAKIVGEKCGNAILIDKKHAITVKHCVNNNEQINLVFPKMHNGKELKAKIISEICTEHDEFVLLELDEEVAQIDIFFSAVRLFPSDEAKVYGYDANYSVDGRWTDIISAGSYLTDPNLVYDMIFDLKTSKEIDFSGLSGSPILKNNHVIGLVSQEALENCKAISLLGISVNSCKDFFSQYHIPYANDDTGKYTFDVNLTTGEHPQNSSAMVSIAGNQQIQGIWSDVCHKKLEEIILLHRSGSIDEAWKELREKIIEFNSEVYVSNEVKSEYYYRMALWFLEDRNNVGKAEKKYQKALELNPNMDSCIYLALKQFYTGENSEPEEQLEPINSVNKFNIYLQICINMRKLEKAYLKYEELDELISMNATSYYLLAILEIMRHEYLNAEEYIEKALKLEDEIPLYYLMKGISYYWQSLPADVYSVYDLYPAMFTTGLIHMDQTQQQMIKQAIAEYRKAYQLADRINNHEQIDIILSCWINTLSVDSSFQEDILEPLHYMQNKNPFNVTGLLYMLQKKMPLNDTINIESLENCVRKNHNKVGHIIVLIEFCLSKNDKQNAKRFLHEYRPVFFKDQYYEYWYEYIIKVEDKKEKLAIYEDEVNNLQLEPIRKRRLLCLFINGDVERSQELETLLTENYEETKNRLDLLNLIAYYKGKRDWEKMLQYADELSSRYKDAYGNIYKIQCLIELQEYDMALCNIDDLESLCIYGTEEKLLEYRMVAYERMGNYDEAIAAGSKLLRINPTEQINLKLADLYSLNGNDTLVLATLLKAEEDDIKSTAIYQRISVCYLTIDSYKALEYAEKAVKFSKNDPGIMLWASNIANTVGKSDKASEYLHYAMMKDSDHYLTEIKTIDEVLEILKSSSEDARKKQEMLYNGDIISHLYVDTRQDDLTYAEFFYTQWNNNEMVPMEFGAHYYFENELKTDIKEIVLDYSACLILHELGIFEVLCAYMEHIYVAGTLFGIISEELRKLPVKQSDLILSRHQTLKKCQDEMNIRFVDTKIPDDVELIDKKAADITFISQYTANSYGAAWVTDNGEDNSIREIEVIAALYQQGKISKTAYETYENCGLTSREEKVQELQEKISCLYVDYDVLLKWDDACFLSAVSETYSVLLNKNMLEESEREYVHLQESEQMCRKLKVLKEVLLQQKNSGKLKFLPMTEEQNRMDYTNMLYSILAESEKRDLPICVDDRVLTSYSVVGDSNIYNSIDMIRILYYSKQITLEQYSTLYKNVIDKRIRYILPDIQFILYAINIYELDDKCNMLIESDMLSGIRKYVIEAVSSASYLKKEPVKHVDIPEREYYIFYLQSQSKELIRLIWQANMQNNKKVAASEWVLCHFSQFTFDFSGSIQEKDRLKICEIQLAHFWVTGLFLGMDDVCTESYYKWLYGWFEDYLQSNPNIETKTLAYTKNFIVSFIKDAPKNSSTKEYQLAKYMFANGIYYMPDKYREYLLKDNIILKEYQSIYSQVSVELTEEIKIPVEVFKSWEKEVLMLDEREILTKRYQAICYTISWEYILPALPGITIQWEEEEKTIIKKMFLDNGARLKHNDRDIRKREFKHLKPYLEKSSCGKLYFALKSQGRYNSAAEKILRLLETSESYVKLRLEKGIEEYWFDSVDTRKLMLPSSPAFFQQIYDFSTDKNEFKGIRNDHAASLPLCFGMTELMQNQNNHNPVRLLHKLGKLFTCKATDEDILTTITTLFSYIDSDNIKYGKIYILFLKYVWYMLNSLENYEDQSKENIIIWTYIWADYMMTALTKLEQMKNIDIAAYTVQLENDYGISLKLDGFWDDAEDEDAICPDYMNLYKLCVTGTLFICSQHKDRMVNMFSQIINILKQKHSEWLQWPIHFGEAELLHKNDNNVFNSIFTTNAITIIEQLSVIGICKIEDWKDGELTSDKAQTYLRDMLNKDYINTTDIQYLTLISREHINKEQTEMIKSNIEKHILDNPFQEDVMTHRHLAAIVNKLPEDFQMDYIQHESKRLGEMLHLGKVNWECAYNITLENTAISGFDSFLNFWEMYADELDPSDALQVAYKISGLQRKLPYQYGDKLRNLRIKLELVS